ncbi:hypothetical protein [Streptomyces sp. NPDC002845]
MSSEEPDKLALELRAPVPGGFAGLAEEHITLLTEALRNERQRRAALLDEAVGQLAELAPAVLRRPVRLHFR